MNKRRRNSSRKRRNIRIVESYNKIRKQTMSVFLKRITTHSFVPCRLIGGPLHNKIEVVDTCLEELIVSEEKKEFNCFNQDKVYIKDFIHHRYLKKIYLASGIYSFFYLHSSVDEKNVRIYRNGSIQLTGELT